MFDLIPIAMVLAVIVAATAAVSDARSGTIPNWITLPPIAAAPLAYAVVLGLEYGLQSLASSFVSGVAPYLMFRRQAMGGGDVKLFAALGAVAGFDPLVGVRIQLTAFALAMFFALCRQAWRGRLLTTLASAAALPLNRVLPLRYQLRVTDDLRTPIRMGGAILLATVTSSLPYVPRTWGGS
ncbi:MAG: A24 family peptidase [Polyangiales bacterium]